MLKTIFLLFSLVTVFSKQPDIGKEYQLPHYTINHPPVVTQNITKKRVQANTFFSYKLPLREVFNNPDGDDLIYEVREKGKEDIPFWIDFDPDDFSFKGEPTEEDQGTYYFIVTAFDQEQKKANQTFALEVLAAPLPQENSDTHFDEDFFWSYVKKSSQNLMKVQNKELILFLGYTGSGKSTTINYLLQNDLKERLDGIKNVIELKEFKAEYPHIGHKKETRTEYSSLYVDRFNPFVYADTPGWESTKGKEIDLFNLISINRFIKRTNTFKAVFCVISLEDIDTQKGALFIEIMKELDLRMHYMTTYASNIFWLFTKVIEDSTKDDFVTAITQIKEARFSKGAQLAEGAVQVLSSSPRKPTAHVSQLFDSILAHKNIFLIKPLDNGESRERIFRALEKLKKNIPQNAFRIPIEYEYKELPFQLKQLFTKRGIIKNNTLGRVEKLTERVEKQEKQLKEIQSTLQQEQPFQTYTKIKEEEKKSWQAVQNKIEKEIEKIRERKEEIVRYKKIKRELSTYFFTKSVNISYKDIPFEKDGPKSSNTSDVLEVIIDNRPSEGIYIATYTLSPNYKNVLIVTTIFATILSFVFPTIARSKPFITITIIFCTGLLCFLGPKKAHIDIEFYSKKAFIDQSYMNTLSQDLESCQGNISQIESYIHDLEQEIKESMETKASNLERRDIMENKKRLTSYQKILENNAEHMALIQDTYELIKAACKNAYIDPCPIYDENLEKFVKYYKQYTHDNTCVETQPT